MYYTVKLVKFSVHNEKLNVHAHSHRIREVLKLIQLVVCTTTITAPVETTKETKT